MPALNEPNVRHLLRRTEFVDRDSRVAELLSKGSISAAVDDIMSVPANPPSCAFDPADHNWWRGVRLAEHWIDQMATSSRPFGERMALFWHGHLCTEIAKTRFAETMRSQIDLFRRRGLGTAAAPSRFGDLLKAVAIQPAMLRYLDNNRNFKDSPNQNWARELMELFVLGVGNYTEADVEAATAAWTGHTDGWDTDVYFFDPAQHHTGALTFLGQRINDASKGHSYREAGNQTIDVMLTSGVIPSGAASNAGRASSDVAAEFLSHKLWQEFGEADSGGVPPGVMGAMKSALHADGKAFGIRPWVRAMLTHDDFYAASTRSGLVRQPIEFLVALMIATGVTTSEASSIGLLDRAGQRPLTPPNVSGWRPNGYWVNASAMEARARLVQMIVWAIQKGPWEDTVSGYIDFPGGRITRQQMKDDTDRQFVERVVAALEVHLTDATLDRMTEHLRHPEVRSWFRLDAVMLALLSTEMHVS